MTLSFIEKLIAKMSKIIPSAAKLLSANTVTVCNVFIPYFFFAFTCRSILLINFLPFSIID